MGHWYLAMTSVISTWHILDIPVSIYVSNVLSRLLKQKKRKPSLIGTWSVTVLVAMTVYLVIPWSADFRLANGLIMLEKPLLICFIFLYLPLWVQIEEKKNSSRPLKRALGSNEVFESLVCQLIFSLAWSVVQSKHYSSKISTSNILVLSLRRTKGVPLGTPSIVLRTLFWNAFRSDEPGCLHILVLQRLRIHLKPLESDS